MCYSQYRTGSSTMLWMKEAKLVQVLGATLGFP